MCRNQNLYGDYLVSDQLVNSNNMVELSRRQSLKNIQKEKPMRVYFNKLKKTSRNWFSCNSSGLLSNSAGRISI